MKVLIVDDEPINAKIAQKFLEKEYSEIVVVDDSRAVMKTMTETDIDLVLLDIRMPYKDGFQVCKEIRNIKKYNDIPIIFLTTEGDIESITKGFDSGGNDYLLKPFKPKELMARVKNHLKLKKAMDTQKEMNMKLQIALDEVKQLSGLLPICSHCKNIRDDKGYWQKVEFFIAGRTDTEFSHGICPDCLTKHYPKMAEKIKLRKEKEAKENSKAEL
jgi:response regulator RpfG family c-di-GMP phosphodiesterase